MSENLKLGHLITSEQQRDAVHIAVAPVEAAQHLEPGQKVSLRDGKAYRAKDSGIGVIDPFLQSKVVAGERCWLYLYPGSITALRHEWAHPAFGTEDKTESEQWLRAFAARLFSYDPEYGTRFDVLIANAESGGFGTDIEYGEGCEPNEEFWMHFERYTGRKVKSRPEYFRCAC